MKGMRRGGRDKYGDPDQPQELLGYGRVGKPQNNVGNKLTAGKVSIQRQGLRQQAGIWGPGIWVRMLAGAGFGCRMTRERLRRPGLPTQAKTGIAER